MDSKQQFEKHFDTENPNFFPRLGLIGILLCVSILITIVSGFWWGNWGYLVTSLLIVLAIVLWVARCAHQKEFKKWKERLRDLE
ncbi:hypothetical protein M1M30_gp174 [Maribacter phage Colly_1]|uniref:Uncharacterized protein n=1 Tax=Maribacter phage Colly_1 TaxID=2745691 RepID=A0A8E4XXU4_9CAUD|nr:hypothetical protein M1M30_gp174 [Maribacter phage Colly_1]QQO97278.1 hypothetical protein Colly1_174 [Maribacter phage Colly_1]